MPHSRLSRILTISYMGACAGLANTHSYGELLGFRILQAVGSASVIAIGSGTIGDVAPPSERGKAMSLFGLGAMSSPVSSEWSRSWDGSLPFSCLALRWELV